MAYNMLAPNKRFSQLIAQSWLKGTELNIDKQWLLDNNLISEAEAAFYDEINVDRNPKPNPSPDKPDGTQYIGKIEITELGTLTMYVPYPQRPDLDKLPEIDLERWVNSTVNEQPWVPENIWIPYSC